MRKMKDSGIVWIGEIPENWGCSKAKYYIQISNGSDPKTDGDIPVYGSGSGCFKSCGESKDGPAVLLGRKGTVDIPRYIEGKYWNVDTAFDVKTDETSLLLKYYFYLSTCFDYRFYTATTTLPSMTQTSYENMFIPVPDIDMQHKIVAYIESKCKELDMIIAAKEKTNELLKERRQSIIYEAVTKGLEPTVPMKDSGIEWIGEIPESWSVWRMKHLAKEPLQYGANATGVEFKEDMPRYVRITDITADRNLSDEGKQSLELDIAEAYMLEDGDILFARSGATAGKSFYYESNYGPCCFAGYLIKLSTDQNKVLSKFLYYYTLTQAYDSWTQQIFIQATIQNIGADKYSNLWFAIPDTHREQMEIVAYLDKKCAEIDSLISANNSTIEKLKEYRQSVIYEAVTGKIEV